MTRLVDADDLMSWSETVSLTDDGGIDINDFEEKLKSMPTIDAEPVRHGKWMFNPSDAFEAMFTKPKCSECGFESADGWNYCPNCGARMDEE